MVFICKFFMFLGENRKNLCTFAFAKFETIIIILKMIQKSNQKVLSLLMLIVLTLTGSMEVKAQEIRDFQFNSGVRYSQWVTKSRMHDFYRNKNQDGFAVYDADGKKSESARSAADYVPGLVAKAIVENVQYYSQYNWAQPWAKAFFYSMSNYCTSYYSNFTTDGGSLDNLNAAKVLFGLYDMTKEGGVYASTSVASSTKTTAQNALSNAQAAFINHNSGYKIANTTPAYTAGHTIVEGGWYHKSTYKDEMWLDGSYMGPALFAQLRNYKGSDIIGSDWTIVYRQIQALWEMCWNPTDKLLYHAFAAKGHDTYSNTWAGFNPTGGVYHSASYWGRACGWYLLALVDILEQMDKAGLSGTANYATLQSHLSELAAGLAARQDAASGCWYQILDEDGTFSANSYSGKSFSTTYNYLESSASALFTAGYLKAIRKGYLSGSTVPAGCSNNYETIAKNGYQGLVNNFFAADGNEGVHLFGSCRSAGLGGTNKNMPRDGSKAYYLLGGDVAKVAKSENVTEGKILGAFILAATEYERLYQDNTVLFEKDLAPSYELEAGDEISCPATGSGANITYQWYKDGVAVVGATNSTIVPTESGSYYCKATSGNTTIQSSTATVTVAGNDTFTPEFTTNLSATATATEGVAKTLTVAANHVESYQWYSNTTASNAGGTPISGATSASYTFTPSATGTLYYYCVATNSKATSIQSVASNVCTITVNEAPAGPTVLYSTDFSNSEWSGITSVCAGKNAANETHNGITFHSYSGDNAGKPFEISQSAGTMTWCNNNMGDNFWIAIPVTGVNGSLTITVDNGTTETRFKYATKQETTVSGSPGSGSNNSSSATDPATVTIDNLDKSDYVVYLGRQGSGLTTLTSITITTPAGGDTPTPTTYTVSYNMNGHGDAIASVEGVTALPSTLPTPTATGWKFGGWYTDSGLTTAATAGASISDNTTLYAKWTEKAAATVSINPNSGNVTVGSTLDISSYVKAGSSTGAISYSTGDASKATVTNAGVITGVAEGETTIIVTQAETEEYTAGSVTFTVTVNAAPTPTTNYTVKFYNGTEELSSSEVAKGTEVEAPTSNPTKDGYTFKGWTTTDGGTLRVVFPYPVYSNVNFYAVWSNTTSGGGGEDETIFSAAGAGSSNLSVPGNTTNQEITSTNATITGGEMYATNKQTSAKDMMKSQVDKYAFLMPNDNTYFKITLNKALQAGDKINTKIYEREDASIGLWFSTDNTNNTKPSTEPTSKILRPVATSSGWGAEQTYTVATGDGICGESTFYIYRAYGKNTYFTDFTITREGQGNDITLDATTDYENFNDYVGANKNVTLKRSFTEGKWTTLVLPFSATTAQVVAAFEYPNDCEFANIKSMTVNDQGTGSIRYVTTSHITANTPILAKIKPNDGLSGKEGFTADEYVFSGVTVVAPTSVVSTSTDGKVEMHGVYKTTGYTQISSDSYFLSGGKFYDWSYLNAMSPFSAYILPVGANTQSIKSISFAEEATGIVNVNGNGNGNANGNESYNLAGQKVGKDYSGIVIIKGKKVFKR